MNRIAKLVGGVAVDFRISTEFTPPDGETWVEVADYVQRGSSLVDGAWIKPDGQPYTDEEMQVTASQLTIWQGLTTSERRSLRAMANTEGQAGDAALLIEGAFMAATDATIDGLAAGGES